MGTLNPKPYGLVSGLGVRVPGLGFGDLEVWRFGGA